MRGMNSGCVDLIYLDPPFNSNTNYAAPIGSKAAGAEFKDTWTLDDIDEEWIDLIAEKKENRKLYRVLMSAMTDSDKSYLVYMSVRLLEMKRILKPNGTIYLHCDPTMSHYLKLVMDAIFGRGNFRNEVIWHYGKMSNSSKNFPANHDVILRYSKTDDYKFNPIKEADSEYRNRFKNFLDAYNRITWGAVKHKTDKLVTLRAKKIQKELGRELEDPDVLFDFDKEFKIQSDVIYCSIIKGNSKEKLDYPTQKPQALLEKIIMASSNPGDVVFDPFCGCATTLATADLLNRNWVGIDISPEAARLIKIRIEDQQGLWKDIIVRNDNPKRTDLGKLPPPRTHFKVLYGEQLGKCNGCKRKIDDEFMEVDHIVAKAKGGTDDIDNLQILCRTCNQLKRTGSMEQLKLKLKKLEMFEEAA
ncbi:MAG: DNA methyltransferase [Hyphomicrobiales bacterium]|nr:DNA methyltransferase [Hyphomicrobiales bacterium]